MNGKGTRWILTFFLVISLILPAAFLVNSFASETSTERETNGYTHTVFAEYCSLSYCPYCPPVSSQLQQIYSSHNYPFIYVTLVYDKNPKIRDRCAELGVQGFPTVVFDGGYTMVRGGQSSAEPFISAIEQCGKRNDIYDVSIDILMRGMGNDRIQVNVTIFNRDSRVYHGTLRAYVAEIESRWRDASQKPYHFAALDFVYDQPISVGGGGKLNLSTIWDGSEYNIDIENTVVIAAVFDSHTDYADNVSMADIYSAYPDTIITSGPEGIINETTVTFTWIGRDREAPVEELLYSYRLEPLYPEWSDWTSETTVTYTNLSEGWYKFEVKAKNPDNEEDPKPATSTFAVNLHHPPEVKISKPGRRLCINNKIYPIPLPIVIWGCDIEVDATDEAGIDHVDFYIDGELKYQDSRPPYRYTTWYTTTLFKRYMIKVIAYDTLGNENSDTVKVWKIL
ncbi:MAG: hypothetical protein DRN19_00125 [Thermoplasmata archaeon]|nr:MAG: hypothetical protein DRN19_00125 [Thermoplasmata archaeon]